MTEEERIKLAVKVKESAASEVEAFESRVDSIRQFLKQFNPLKALAFLSVYGLAAPPLCLPEKDRKYPLLSADLELIQAIILSTPPSDFGEEVFRDSHFLELFRLVKQAGLSFAFKRLITFPEAEEAKNFYILELIRVHTQSVRNWAYYFQLRSLIPKFYSALDQRVKKELRAEPSQLWNFLVVVGEEFQARLNKYIGFQKMLSSAKTLKKASQIYFSMLGASPAEVTKSLPNIRKTFREAWEAKRWYKDTLDAIFLSSFLEFSEDWINANWPTSIEDRDTVLESLSIPLGGLTTRNVEHFFLGNPIWCQPFIMTPAKGLFLANPQLIQSFPFEIIEQGLALKKNSKIKKAIEERRAEFLESEVDSLFRKHFPSCGQFFGNRHWLDAQGKSWETDFFSVWEGVGCIAESKSHSLPDAAKRGAEKSLREFLVDTSLEASEQSIRLRDRLSSLSSCLEFKDKEGGIVVGNVMPGEVSKCWTISVSLDLLGLPLSWKSFEYFGLGEVVGKAPRLTLSDLEIVLDVLSDPIVITHYFLRRQILETQCYAKADELDWLAFYLETAFNLGEIETDGTWLDIYGKSSDIDDYYRLKGIPLRVHLQKPARKFTSWWSAILTTLSRKKRPGWLDRSLTLLDLSYLEQVDILDCRDKLARNVERHRQSGPVVNTCHFVYGPSVRRKAIILVVHDRETKAERQNTVENASTQLFDQHEDVHSILVIGYSKSIDEPYSYMMGVSRIAAD
ncbi:MAG: hypothetical protein KIS61_23110 [Candidatus Eremiobacteraeota bacterium]|nr:hypothetical protein [Candidatus Eremiobacteraeota bacterium]